MNSLQMGDNLETIKVLQRGHSLDNIHAYLDVNINCGGVSLAPSSALFAIVYSRKSDSYRILDCKISCQDAVLVNGKPCAGKLVDGDSLTIASYPQPPLCKCLNAPAGQEQPAPTAIDQH